MKFYFFRFFAWFLVVFGVISIGYSQTKLSLDDVQKVKIRELENKVNYHKKDTLLVSQISELSRLFSSIKQYDQALYLANKSLTIAQKIKYSKGIASSYASLGSIYFESNQYEKSIETLLLALRNCKENKQLEEMTFIYRFLGEAYLKTGDKTSAIYYHKQGLSLSKKLNIPNRVAFAHDFLGYIYFHNNDYTNAVYHFKHSLAIFNKMDQPHRVALSAGNIGLSYIFLNNKRESIQFLILASKYYEMENNTDGFLWMNSLISNVYKEIGEYQKALTYNEMNFVVYEKKQNLLGLAQTYKQKGEISLARNLFDEARGFLQMASKLYTVKNSLIGQVETIISLGELYYLKSEYKMALEILQKGKEIAIDLADEKLSNSIEVFYAASLLKQGKTLEGKNRLEKSLAFFKEANTSKYLPFIHQNLAFSDSILGEYASSLEHYKLFVHHYEIENRDKFDTRKIAYQYEFEKKEALALSELKNKNMQRNAAVLGLIFLTVLIVVLVYFFRLRTKKHKIEKENVELQKREALRIKEVEQFKSRFLANITHEFRTPLTLIKGHLEVMKENEEVTNQSRVNEMEVNSDRLIQLIDQLIDLSKIESKNYKLKYSKGDLLKTIKSSVQVFHSLAIQKQLNLSCTFDATFDSDYNQDHFLYSKEVVMTVLSNLLSNAFKFTPEGGDIQVNVGLLDVNTLLIEVSDTGIGIPADKINFVFDRYHQVDSPLQQNQNGSGIGLAIVKELVSLHGGSVYLESKPGEKTVFTIHLKNASEFISELNLLDLKESESTSTLIYSEEKQLISFEKPIILVVEDQLELRGFIVDNIGSDYQFLEASNGKEGIKLAEKHLPDLIISDVMMPDTDGLELCKTLKNQDATSHIPIILLTAKSQQTDKVVGLEHGADDYIVKPFSLVEIRLRVKNMLRTRALFRNKFVHSNVLTSEEKNTEFNQKEKEFLEKLESIITANISNRQFGVPTLAEEMFLSTSQLTRKLKSLIDKSPALYIKNMRFEKAKQLLLDGFNVSETAWEVGFDDSVYFSKEFKKHFGDSPSFVAK